MPIAELAVLKKLSPAVTADAATSAVLASFVIAVFSAVLRLVWVLAGLTGTLASIAKLPTGVGVAVDAVRSICSVEPSGSVNFTLSLSPLFGLVPLRFTENDTGEPLGPVTVAPVNVEETAAILSPNGDPATSSDTCTAPDGKDVCTSRPVPVPRSAAWRSARTVLKPACVVVPLMMSPASATGCVLTAVPENR
ncbi:hypothetical protein ACVWW3_003637 [Bradyrhizobium sp. LM2.9]